MYTNINISENIDLSIQSRKSRYLLNDYITREKKKISINEVEYEVTLYQGDHSNEYLLSEMKDGKVEGRCQLFNRGILSLAWMMKNGKRIGGVTLYENGKAISKEGWDSLLGNEGEDRRMIENSKEGLIMTIRCHCKEDEEDDGCVIYRGGFDEEMNRDGYGIEHDMDNGKEKIEGYWEKDRLIRMIREFDADNNQMIEYAENKDNDDSDVEILSRIPIYIGGYNIENGKYVRNGKGYLIDKESGTATRESEWKNGKEKKEVGIDLYEGWYMKGMNESIRSILKNENPSEMKSESFLYSFTKPIEIHNSSELKALDLKIKDLVICSNSCNGMNALDLNRFECLRSIEIGDHCFRAVQEFQIDGLSRLKTIKIGRSSFTHQNESYFDEWGFDQSKSFHILNCKSLESIEIGEYSFSDFGGEFELKYLTQLRSIQIGTIKSISWNFYHCSFVIRGIELILNI